MLQATIDIPRSAMESTGQTGGLEGGCDFVHLPRKAPGLGGHASSAAFGLPAEPGLIPLPLRGQFRPHAVGFGQSQDGAQSAFVPLVMDAKHILMAEALPISSPRM